MPTHPELSRNKWKISLANFSAGALAGATALTITFPLDIAHTRLATDTGNDMSGPFQISLSSFYHQEIISTFRHIRQFPLHSSMILSPNNSSVLKHSRG